MNNNHVIDVEGLTKRFGDFTAVDHISFYVKRGEIFGFLGANGAGKTTAMRMLSGLLKPSGGSGHVAGVNIFKAPEKVKNKIGYMSQKFSLYEDLTVRENIWFYAGIYGIKSREIKEKTRKVLHQLELSDQENSMIASLPLGWKQRLAFGVALVHDPQIIFLDEPTAGVDPVSRRQFWNTIYQTAGEGITVFVTTHYMDEAEYCDRISMMVEGHITDMGSPQELKEKYNAGSMEDVFLHIAGEKQV
ncbi:ABC transporter ATP-binding protein [Bacteroidota bacterium]